MKQTDHEWMTGPQVWTHFTEVHPELGYRPGRMNFHNFLRLTREPLLKADAIRLARGRHWIAHTSRFCETAFDLATNALSTIEKTQPHE